jgi:hypothetical protein
MLALGLLVPAGDEVFDVPQPPLLRAGITLVAQGVPLATTLRELEELQAELGAIATRSPASSRTTCCRLDRRRAGHRSSGACSSCTRSGPPSSSPWAG